ncbi:MAG: response regulator transcription factor [Chloroflexi bacterium]|nr:response regulator transcription factor [Chloroflexota bacterium]
MEKAANILIVDDDEAIRSSLRRSLALEGYKASIATDGDEALRLVREQPPDLVVLDVMMPTLDGLEVCRRLRASDTELPIIMLTARDAVPDRVAGLENGADDYLVKPFAFEELLARIRVRLRRREAPDRHELLFADLRLDTAAREAQRGERVIALTTTEYELLRCFLEHPRRVLNRDLIYRRVWGYDFGSESKVIEVYVKYLRDKLEAGGEARLIHTVRGAGYVLKQGD